MDDEQFFRQCWLTVKRSKPRWVKFMNEVEYAVSGVPKVKEEPTLQKKSEVRNEERITV